MRIAKYGVVLKRISYDDIDILRQWRNDPKINQYMEYREYITPDMQKMWFENLDPNCDYYFIIEMNAVKIGMINIKNIQWDRKTGETGIFIYDDSMRASEISFRATCALLDFYFENLQLDRAEAHILQDNKKAQRFNKCFGYVLQPNQNEILNQLYILKKDSYIENRAHIVRAFCD